MPAARIVGQRTKKDPEQDFSILRGAFDIIKST